MRMMKGSERGFVEEEKSLALYLREISDEPLLKPEQEADLARRIRDGQHEALDHLVKANLRFVVSVARQYRNRGLSLSDLISEGNAGLVRAAKTFDEKKGCKFISYAIWWIRQRILQAIAEQSRIVRLPLNRAGTLSRIGKTSGELGHELGREPTAREIADHLDLSEKEVTDTLKVSIPHLSIDAPTSDDDDGSLREVIPDKDAPSPDSDVISRSLQEDVADALESLNDREAKILTLYFGIGREEALTLEEIGRILGLTRERVRQIKEKAIKKLRHASRSSYLQAYLN
ncbi:RNA polymerase sigma factor RpoD/SigA [Candidatus Eisenbacteria bacterium]|uniref:RNA polymerase sigma factor RpoD/SigA n=1 Tax=Eiseniibacteriota bacterium TaxID=2212470 RepID=A0ABV6YNU4_UNCEI